MYVNNLGSHSKNILQNLPKNVDWSNLCPFGSKAGTVDAVDDSTIDAATATVVIPASAARAVWTSGTDCDSFLEEDEEAVEDEIDVGGETLEVEEEAVLKDEELLSLATDLKR